MIPNPVAMSGMNRLNFSFSPTQYLMRLITQYTTAAIAGTLIRLRYSSIDFASFYLCALLLIKSSIWSIASVTGPSHPCSFNPFKQARTPCVKTVCSSFIATMSMSCFSCLRNHLNAPMTTPMITPTAVMTDATVVMISTM